MFKMSTDFLCILKDALFIVLTELDHDPLLLSSIGVGALAFIPRADVSPWLHHVSAFPQEYP